MKRFFFSLLLIVLLTEDIYTKTLHTKRQNIQKQLGKTMDHYQKHQLKKKYTTGHIRDPELEFQKAHIKNPTYLFHYYFDKTFAVIRKYIDNYLTYVTEKKIINKKYKNVNGKKLERYFKWMEKFSKGKTKAKTKTKAVKHQHRKGILHKFSFKQLRGMLLKINQLLRFFKLIKKHKAVGHLPKGYHEYYKAFKKGFKFLVKFKKEIRNYQEKLMRKNRTLKFSNSKA